MENLFSPPFDTELLTKRKQIRRKLLEEQIPFIDKRVAILGGSTTHDIRDALERKTAG